MEIYFSVNNRETVLGGDINVSLIEYQYKSISNGVEYKITLNGINTDTLHFHDNEMSDPKSFLEDLYLQHKEFRFIITNEKLKLEDSNFIGVFENFQLNKNNILVATIKRK